jgi:hypothetical protein
MERISKQRARALVAAMACMVGGIMAGMGSEESAVGSAGTATPGEHSAPAADGREDALERLRGVIDAEASRLRGLLDAAESGRDWTTFLEHKCTVDAALAPLHLVRDAMESQVPGAAVPDLLRSIRTEWRDEPVRSTWSHPDGAERARHALSAWVPAPDGGPDGAWSAVRMEVRTGSTAWVGGEAPPFLCWTIDASWVADGPSVHARCWWRIPLAEPVRVDFPLAGDGFDLWWTKRGARLQDDRGNAHAEEWAEHPVFNNPPEIYAAFDALRVAAAGDRGIDVAPASVPNEAPAASRADGPLVRDRTVRRADGSLLRTERWQWEGGALRSVEIEQAPVRMVHFAERGYEIVTEAEGRETGRSPHRPHSEVTQFPNGARMTLWFRRPDPMRDATVPGIPDAAVPDRWELSVDGTLRAWAEFRAVRAGRIGEVEPEATAILERLRTESAEHRAFAAQLDRAIAERSPEGARRAIEAIAARIDACDPPALQQAAEWELAAAMLLDAGMDAAGDAVLAGRWMPLVDASAAATASARWRAHGRDARAEHIERVAGITAPATGSATQPVAEPAAALGTEVAPEVPAKAVGRCDPSALTGGARRVHDEVHAAIARSVKDAAHARRISDALCGACSRAAAELEGVPAERAASLASDARSALAAGIGHPDAEGAQAADDAASAFAELAVRAAQRPPLEADRVGVMRAAWDRCARAATAALRKASATAGTGAEDAVDGEDGAEHSTAQADGKSLLADVRRALRLQRGLVGNAFAPALDADAGLQPPSAEELRAFMTRALGDVLARERRRAEVVAGVLGGELGGARDAAARRRIADATVGAVTQAYVRWKSAPIPRPAG